MAPHGFRWRVGLLAVLIQAAVLLRPGDALAADGWYPTFLKPFSSSFGYRDNSVAGIAQFGGNLYIGTGDSAHGFSAHVYRLVSTECKIWHDISPPIQPVSVPYGVPPYWWSSPTGGDFMPMLGFGKHLYVGTDQGEVLRTSDGMKWRNVTGGWVNLFPQGSVNPITALTEFDGHLYVALRGIEIWRTPNGLDWEPVVGPAPALHPAEFGVPSNHDLLSLEDFDGRLYAGVGKDGFDGIQIWRTDDGVHWERFKAVGPPPPGLYPGHVQAMQSYNGRLYIGDSEGTGIFSTGSSASTWKYIHPKAICGSGVSQLEKHGPYLYLGMYNFSPDDHRSCENGKLVYRSMDGVHWGPVPGSPINHADHIAVSAMLRSGGKLYVGTKSHGDTGTLYMYQYGAVPGACIAHAVKKAVNELSSSIRDTKQLLEKCMLLPCGLEVYPLIKPIPPSDEPPEVPFDFLLLDGIVNAVVNELEVTPGDEALRDIIVENLGLVFGEVVEALSPGSGEDARPGAVVSSAVENAIGHLDAALELCHDTSVVLSLMDGKGPRKLPPPLRGE